MRARRWATTRVEGRGDGARLTEGAAAKRAFTNAENGGGAKIRDDSRGG